ncbi:hypothetical protein BOX15_Mlig011956g1, partial [Macrostomum lignano]
APDQQANLVVQRMAHRMFAERCLICSRPGASIRCLEAGCGFQLICESCHTNWHSVENHRVEVLPPPPQAQRRCDTWLTERLQEVKQLREFKDFSDTDLIDSIQSCEKACDDVVALLAHLRSQCCQCSKQMPRHKLFHMATCECELCCGCFCSFLSGMPGQLECPVCGVAWSGDHVARNTTMILVYELESHLGNDEAARLLQMLEQQQSDQHQREQQEREEQLRDQLREQQEREEQLRDQLREQQEREEQLRYQLKEQQEREEQLRDQLRDQLREQQEREEQLRDQLRELQKTERKQREQQQRQQQQREQQQREQQQREQQQKEQQQREQQQREKQLQREQQEREEQLRDQLRELQKTEQQQREQQQREQQQREQQQREQQQREQQQREQQQREQQQREKQQEQNRQLHGHHTTNVLSNVTSQNFQENNSQSKGSWICNHCTLVNPAPSQPETGLGICSACTYITKLIGGATKGGAVARSEAAAAASMLTSAATSAASAAVGAAGSDSTEWSDKAQNLALQLRVENWVAERILVVKSMPKFKEFSESDLVVAIESCGDLAFEDDALMSQLRRKCNRCSNDLPRHKLVAMAVCECQMCPECFKKFLVDLKSSRIQCPACQGVCDDEDSRDFMKMQLMEMADVLGSDTVEYAVAHLEENSSKKSDEGWEVVEAAGKKGTKSKASKDASTVAVNTSNGYCPHRNGGLPKMDTRQCESYCKVCKQDVCKKCFGFWVDHQRINCSSYRDYAAGIQQKEDYNEMHTAAQKQGFSPTDANLHDQMMELLTFDLVCPNCSLCYQRVSKSGYSVFHCRCGHSFCPFCRSPQKRPHEGCPFKGFHVHHQRQCYFNLKQVKQTTFLDLLRGNKVKVSEACLNVGKACELPDLKMDGKLTVCPCTEKVTHNKPGICDRHYREYLIQLINANKLDLVDVANENELLEMFRRFRLALPQVKASNPSLSAAREKMKVYRERLKDMVPPLWGI